MKREVGEVVVVKCNSLGEVLTIRDIWESCFVDISKCVCVCVCDLQKIKNLL